MNITAIYGATPNMTYNSDLLSRIVLDTLLEIGVYVDEIKLIDKNIPYLNSTVPNVNVANIMSTISNSDGVIFICTSNFFTPSSVMQNFLDYFSLPIYKNILKNKNCFLLTVSNVTGEKSSLQYLSNIVQELGGYDSIKIGLNYETAKLITTDHQYKSNFERYVEDFYRYVNQNRNFFVASDVTTVVNTTNNNRTNSTLQQNNDYTVKQKENFSNNNKHIANYSPSNNASITNKKLQSLNEKYTNNLNHSNRNNNFNNTQNITSNNYNVGQNGNISNNNYSNNNKSPVSNIYSSKNNINVTNDDELFLQSILSGDDNDFNSIKNEISTEAKSMSINQENNANNNQKHNTTDKQKQNDIKEMAKYFQGKYSPTSNNETITRNPVINEPLVTQPEHTVTPNDKTIKQLTKNLVHYYQPTIGNGLVTEIQLNITGSENFDGFLRVNNNQCDYFDGWADTPDVTIISNDITWKKILNGDVSSQRAFMTGQLKVRGNFVILSKFDQLFNLHV